MEQTTQKRKIKYSYIIIGVLVGLFCLIQAPFSSALSTTRDIYNFSIDTNNHITFTPNITSGRLAICADGPTCASTLWYTDINPPQNTIIGASVSGGSGSYLCDTNKEGNNVYLIFSNSDGNGQTGTGDYYYPLACNSSIWHTVSSDGFNTTITLPNSTLVSSGYNYVGDNFGDINIKMTGANSSGLFNQFLIDVWKDGEKINANYSIPISLSCSNCDLANFNISDTRAILYRYHQYKFTIKMSSTITDSIIKEINIDWDYTAIIYEECATTDIACYIRNGLKWAFFVPAGSFDDFLILKSTIENKPPFGYLTSAINSLLGLNNTTTGAFTLQQVTPITDTIFTPIKNGLSWFFYFLFIFALIKRFKDIQI